MNTLLIGARGAGKTTIGRLAARKLNRAFIDLDEEVCKQFSQISILEIWAVHGEAMWRAAEAVVLDKLLDAGDRQIIALGAGAPTISTIQTRIESLRNAGRVQVIYLYCGVEALKRRLEELPGDRPSLTGARLTDEVVGILAERDPVYLALADAQIDASAQSPSALADQLAALLNAG